MKVGRITQLKAEPFVEDFGVDFSDLKKTIKKLVKENKLKLEKEQSIEEYGIFKHGMTVQEVNEYLKERNKKYKIRNVYNKFGKIAGVNTGALVICPECGKQISLMYRHDVLRFADKLFLGKETYFD